MLSPATAAGLEARFYLTSATPPTVKDPVLLQTGLRFRTARTPSMPDMPGVRYPSTARCGGFCEALSGPRFTRPSSSIGE